VINSFCDWESQIVENKDFFGFKPATRQKPVKNRKTNIEKQNKKTNNKKQELAIGMSE
jgi:hypothetical protein